MASCFNLFNQHKNVTENMAKIQTPPQSVQSGFSKLFKFRIDYDELQSIVNDAVSSTKEMTSVCSNYAQQAMNMAEEYEIYAKFSFITSMGLLAFDAVQNIFAVLAFMCRMMVLLSDGFLIWRYFFGLPSFIRRARHARRHGSGSGSENPESPQNPGSSNETESRSSSFAGRNYGTQTTSGNTECNMNALCFQEPFEKLDNPPPKPKTKKLSRLTSQIPSGPITVKPITLCYGHRKTGFTDKWVFLSNSSRKSGIIQYDRCSHIAHLTPTNIANTVEESSARNRKSRTLKNGVNPTSKAGRHYLRTVEMHSLTKLISSAENIHRFQLRETKNAEKSKTIPKNKILNSNSQICSTFKLKPNPLDKSEISSSKINDEDSRNKPLIVVEDDQLISEAQNQFSNLRQALPNMSSKSAEVNETHQTTAEPQPANVNPNQPNVDDSEIEINDFEGFFDSTSSESSNLTEPDIRIKKDESAQVPEHPNKTNPLDQQSFGVTNEQEITKNTKSTKIAKRNLSKSSLAGPRKKKKLSSLGKDSSNKCMKLQSCREQKQINSPNIRKRNCDNRTDVQTRQPKMLVDKGSPWSTTREKDSGTSDISSLLNPEEQLKRKNSMPLDALSSLYSKSCNQCPQEVEMGTSAKSQHLTTNLKSHVFQRNSISASKSINHLEDRSSPKSKRSSSHLRKSTSRSSQPALIFHLKRRPSLSPDSTPSSIYCSSKHRRRSPSPYKSNQNLSRLRGSSAMRKQSKTPPRISCLQESLPPHRKPSTFYHTPTHPENFIEKNKNVMKYNRKACIDKDFAGLPMSRCKKSCRPNTKLAFQRKVGMCSKSGGRNLARHVPCSSISKLAHCPNNSAQSTVFNSQPLKDNVANVFYDWFTSQIVPSTDQSESLEMTSNFNEMFKPNNIITSTTKNGHNSKQCSEVSNFDFESKVDNVQPYHSLSQKCSKTGSVVKTTPDKCSKDYSVPRRRAFSSSPHQVVRHRPFTALPTIPSANAINSEDPCNRDLGNVQVNTETQEPHPTSILRKQCNLAELLFQW